MINKHNFFALCFVFFSVNGHSNGDSISYYDLVDKTKQNPVDEYIDTFTKTESSKILFSKFKYSVEYTKNNYNNFKNLKMYSIEKFENITCIKYLYGEKAIQHLINISDMVLDDETKREHYNVGSTIINKIIHKEKYKKIIDPEKSCRK